MTTPIIEPISIYVTQVTVYTAMVTVTVLLLTVERSEWKTNSMPLSAECLLDFDLSLEPANSALSVFDPVPNILVPPAPRQQSEPHLDLDSPASSSSSSRFSELKTDSDLEEAKASSIPENSVVSVQMMQKPSIR